MKRAVFLLHEVILELIVHLLSVTGLIIAEAAEEEVETELVVILDKVVEIPEEDKVDGIGLISVIWLEVMEADAHAGESCGTKFLSSLTTART